MELRQFEPLYDKTNKMSVRPAKTQISLHPAKTRISLGIRPVWSESLLCALRVAKDPSFLHADSEDWSDWVDAQADLSLRWAHSHIVGFVMSRLIWKFPYFSLLMMHTIGPASAKGVIPEKKKFPLSGSLLPILSCDRS